MNSRTADMIANDLARDLSCNSPRRTALSDVDNLRDLTRCFLKLLNSTVYAITTVLRATNTTMTRRAMKTTFVCFETKRNIGMIKLMRQAIETAMALRRILEDALCFMVYAIANKRSSAITADNSNEAQHKE